MLQLLVRASVLLYAAFVLSLYDPHLLFRCFGKAVNRDFGISWVSSLIF